MMNHAHSINRWTVWLALMLVSMTATGDIKHVEAIPVSPGDITTTNFEVGACPSFSWALSNTQREKIQLGVWQIQENAQNDWHEAIPGKLVINRVFPAGARVWTPNRGECLRGNAHYAWSVRIKGQEEWPEPLYFKVTGGVSTDMVRAVLENIGSTIPDTVVHGNRVPARTGDDLQSLAQGISQPRKSKSSGHSTQAAPSTTLATGADSTSVYATVGINGGTNYGVHGITMSPDLSSAGIIGQSTATSGVTYGVVGVVNSANGVAGVFESTGGGDAIRGFSNGTQVFSVSSLGYVTAEDFTGDGSDLIPPVAGLACTSPCVSRGEIIKDSVEDSNLAPNSVTTSKFGGGITPFHIATDAVETSELATDAVGEDEIATFAVGAADIQTNAVGSDELDTNEIEGVDLAINAIIRSKIMGVEVEIYEVHSSCADDGDLTLSSNCLSVQGTCSAGQFQTCGGGCSASQQSCSNSLEGYLIEP